MIIQLKETKYNCTNYDIIEQDVMRSMFNKVQCN